MNNMVGCSYRPLTSALGSELLCERAYSSATPRSDLGESTCWTPAPKRQVSPFGRANEVCDWFL